MQTESLQQQEDSRVCFSAGILAHKTERKDSTANRLAGGSLQQSFCLWQGAQANWPLRVTNFCQQKEFFLLQPPRLFLISCAAEGNSSLKLPPDSKICFSRHLCLQPPRTVGDKTLFFLLFWPTNLFCKGQLWFGTLRLSYSLQAGLLLLWAYILLLLRVQTYLSSLWQPVSNGFIPLKGFYSPNCCVLPICNMCFLPMTFMGEAASRIRLETEQGLHSDTSLGTLLV